MSIAPWAEPFAADGGEIGVVVLHGFTGSPKSVTPWARTLAAEGWTVRVPLLPGHGTTWQEMNRTTWQDWYAAADAAIEQVRKQCSTVVVMGLSMGGALALRAAEQSADVVSGLVLVNPAVHSERPDRFLLPVLSKVVPSFPGISNDIAKPGQDEGAYNRLPLRAAHSMTQLWAAVKADIALVRAPLLIFRSVQDHVVEPSNAAWILANVSSPERAEVLLENSYHVATIDHDAPLIEQGSIEFVRRLTR